MMRAPSASSSTVRSAPKLRSMRSLWSRVATGSITRVIPGALRPASSTADLTWADAIGSRYSIGTAGQAPRTISGRRSPGEVVNSAPMRDKGSVTRRIGRRESDASPMKVAVTAWLATSPISSRVEVPELPISSALAGCSSPPTPTPLTIHTPSSRRTISAPMARSAPAVAWTSSPSSRPSMRLSPMLSAENMSARCEIDLSPGTRTRPESGRAALKAAGEGAIWCMIAGPCQPTRRVARRPTVGLARACARRPLFFLSELEQRGET